MEVVYIICGDIISTHFGMTQNTISLNNTQRWKRFFCSRFVLRCKAAMLHGLYDSADPVILKVSMGIQDIGWGSWKALIGECKPLEF